MEFWVDNSDCESLPPRPLRRLLFFRPGRFRNILRSRRFSDFFVEVEAVVVVVVVVVPVVADIIVEVEGV
jgi:hypothetical protein